MAGAVGASLGSFADHHLTLTSKRCSERMAAKQNMVFRKNRGVLTCIIADDFALFSPPGRAVTWRVRQRLGVWEATLE